MEKNKFNAQKTEVDGYLFHSKKESERYIFLKIAQRRKLISDLELQPPFKISVKGKHICRYTADFRYKDKDGNIVIEDVKGYKKGMAYQYWKLKWKLLQALEPNWIYKEI